jgi:hypothetical protein
MNFVRLQIYLQIYEFYEFLIPLIYPRIYYLPTHLRILRILNPTILIRKFVKSVNSWIK